jgi:hypothetical protein
MSLAAGTRLGSYEVSRPAGVGGNGRGVSRQDTNLKRQVALKVLPASSPATSTGPCGSSAKPRSWLL